MGMVKQRRKAGMVLMLMCMVILCRMTGVAAEKKVALNKTSVVIAKSDTVQLKLKGASGKVKWSSSRKSVAAVTSSGKIKARKVGECVIKAVYRKKIYTCKVKVTRNRFERVLMQNPVQKNQGKILLAGSSSMRRWSSADKAFAPYEVVNMAISGSTIKQWSQWYDRMIIPYEPEVVVWYVGGNDLWHKRTPAATAKLFCTTVEKLHRALPDTKIYFVSVYTNISRKSISRQILAYNKKVKEFCKKNDYITCIDLATKFNNSKTPLKKLLADGLHPNEKGYKIWKDVVAAKVKADMKVIGMIPGMETSAGSAESSVGKTANGSHSGMISGTQDGGSGSGERIITGTEIYEDEVSGELSQTNIS